jgi:hypothetical protein
MAAPISTTISETERERIAQYVCGQLSRGRSIRKIFEEDKREQKLPALGTFLAWRLDDARLHERIAHARASGLEQLLEEIPEIADNKDEDPQSRRVRVYARLEVAAKLAPALYGQRMDVTSGGKPLPAAQPTVVIDNRVQSILMIVQQRKEADEATRLLLD